MKALIPKISVAAIGLSLALAPMAASAQSVGIGVNVGGPGYSVHAGYVNPGGPCYGCTWHGAWVPPPHYWHPYYPARVAYYNGYYGLAPGGFYGYYWHGAWYAHRRWTNGVWIYF